jgi:kinesin family protein 18/19
MLGTEHNPGVMYRTLHDLFVEIKEFEGKREYQVSMSYLEIYNELIRDLLAPSSSSFLELREDAKGTIQVAGLSEVIAKTPEEVMEMLHKGNRARTQEPTKANKTSSRSHAVLQVNIKQREVTRSHTEQVRFGKIIFCSIFRINNFLFLAKLYMIDLAGSERAAQTQNTGRRMMEGIEILLKPNKDLPRNFQL